MFGPYKVIIGRSKKTDLIAVLCFTALCHPKCLQAFIPFSTSLYSCNKTCKHLGSHNAGKLNSPWIFLLGRPEDDLLCRNMSP